MTTLPPPYAARDHAQVQSSSSLTSVASSSRSEPPLEFAESTTTCLEWRLTGLKAMYDATKGEAKSKCVKSAVFGDADNLWEVLWYANAGAQGGDATSLYLSCVPTAQERDQSVGGKWTRKGLWWFRFEIKSLVPDERTNKIVTLASKDAADHTFAVKTANWGWQQFAKRDALFLHPTVLAADGVLIVCTIQAQPQPPAGYWLGIGTPASTAVSANTVVNGKNVGSGGGLSAWAGGGGANGGVAGGLTAGGGIRSVVPRTLISSIGSLLDDPLYSDIEFILPNRSSRRAGSHRRTRRIYANKKLLLRYEYFEAMFEGGFGEEQGLEDSDEDEDEEMDDLLSDSDIEEEGEEVGDSDPPSGHNLTTTTSRASDSAAPRRVPSPPASAPHSNDGEHDHPDEEERNRVEDGGDGLTGERRAEEPEDVYSEGEVKSKGDTPSAIVASQPIRQTESDVTIGPRKTRVYIRDAAWSTWWAILYWIYTDVIVFAPLSSSFSPAPSSTPTHGRHGSAASFHTATDQPSRRQWIQQWLDEHGIGDGEPGSAVGPQPVSAKAVYRLADKLDFPELKLRAFQHICSQLTPANIPAEVFSRFSSTYEDVRKVQVAFFLRHWGEIKKSETMTQIWQQIRLGKHVGFEEVWPLIVSQLEFKQA